MPFSDAVASSNLILSAHSFSSQGEKLFKTPLAEDVGMREVGRRQSLDGIQPQGGGLMPTLLTSVI